MHGTDRTPPADPARPAGVPILRECRFWCGAPCAEGRGRYEVGTPGRTAGKAPSSCPPGRPGAMPPGGWAGPGRAGPRLNRPRLGPAPPDPPAVVTGRRAAQAVALLASRDD